MHHFLHTNKQTHTRYTNNNNERWKLRQSFPGHHGCVRTPVFVGPEENRTFFWYYFYTLCRLFSSVILFIPNPIDYYSPRDFEGELGRQKETKLTSRISLSLNSHFDDDIRTHTHTWSALYAARRPLRLAGVRCCCRFFLVRIRFFLFVDWVFGVKHFLRGKIVVTLLFSLF